MSRISTFAIIFLVSIQILAFAKAESKEAKSDDKAKPADEAVVTLTTANFNTFVKENPVVLAEFYAPWCGHCKSLAPEYESAAKHLKETGGIPLAKIDATVETELATKFGVQGYPTLKLFRNGKPEDYTGGRTKDTIIEWIAKMTGPAVVILSPSDVKKEAESADTVFVGLFTSKDSAAYKIFEAVANSNRIFGKHIASFDQDHKDEVSVHRKEEGQAATIKDFDEVKLEKWTSIEKFPFFGPINGENYPNYYGSGVDLVWFAGTSKDYTEAKEVIREAAKELRDKHYFVWLDTAEFASHAENTLGVKEFPALVLQTKAGRYVYPETEFKKSPKILTFFKDIEAGKIEKTLKSDPIPAKNDEPVKIVVGKSFEELVLQKDKDVMLEVYAPWCGHCKKLEPVYNQFAEKLADNKHIVIAKMDGTNNEAPVENFETTGFPTIFFVKAGEKSPINFDGARTLEGLMEFVKKHASKPIDVEGEKKDEL